MNKTFKPILDKAKPNKFDIDAWITKTEEQAPTVDENKVEMISPEALALIKEQGFKEGVNEGYEQGLKEAKQEIELMKSELAHLIALFTRPLRLIDNEVKNELIELAAWLTQQMLRSELSIHPEKILTIFDEIRELLPSFSSIKTLHLHPDDHQQLLNFLATDDSINIPSESLQVDKELSRGEYRLETTTSVIDSRLEVRLQELIQSLLVKDEVEDEL